MCRQETVTRWQRRAAGWCSLSCTFYTFYFPVCLKHSFKEAFNSNLCLRSVLFVIPAESAWCETDQESVWCCQSSSELALHCCWLTTQTSATGCSLKVLISDVTRPPKAKPDQAAPPGGWLQCSSATGPPLSMWADCSSVHFIIILFQSVADDRKRGGASWLKAGSQHHGTTSKRTLAPNDITKLSWPSSCPECFDFTFVQGFLVVNAFTTFGRLSDQLANRSIDRATEQLRVTDVWYVIDQGIDQSHWLSACFWTNKLFKIEKVTNK